MAATFAFLYWLRTKTGETDLRRHARNYRVVEEPIRIVKDKLYRD